MNSAKRDEGLAGSAAEGRFNVRSKVTLLYKNRLIVAQNESAEVCPVKSAKVIDEIEKTLPEKLRPCRYCGGEAEEYIREDRNSKYEKGFVSKIKCAGCGRSVEYFALDRRSASVMARNYYQKGVYDA